MIQQPLFLGIYPKELKTYVQKTLHMDVYSSFIHNCQNSEATKISCRWMNKPWYIQIMEFYSVLKNKWAIKPWKDMEEPQMHITKWKETSLSYKLYDSNYMTF